jgi:hypothetical protein
MHERPDTTTVLLLHEGIADSECGDPTSTRSKTPAAA